MFSHSELVKLSQKVKASENFCGTTRVITIDGPAGSGKTTLAQELAAELENCQIVHMDDLYDGWNQDLTNELPSRIIELILMPLSQGQSGKYLKYNWATEQFDVLVEVPVSKYLILEGVGSGHPLVSEQAALSIWIEADPEILLDRLVSRDGQLLKPELIKWQKHEAQYFAAKNIRLISQVHLRGDSHFHHTEQQG